jgi:hypothetical protein
MKNPTPLILIVGLTLACTRGGDVAVSSQKVLGVTLGGTAQELQTLYRQSGLSLNKISEDRYESSVTVDPPAGLHVVSVSYQVSSGTLRTVEASFAGDVIGKLQTFIDEKYGIDPAWRLQLEQKQRFIGTIGEDDHYWQLPDMSIMVIARKGMTLLIYNLK